MRSMMNNNNSGSLSAEPKGLCFDEASYRVGG
jgi:hypothetical protein